MLFISQLFSQTNISWIPKFLELLDYWNLRDILRPFVKKVMNLVLGNVMRDVNEIDQMTEPRVIKSHLPLYLLHPELLDTAKVFTFEWCLVENISYDSS